jgi:hypothetical protein
VASGQRISVKTADSVGSLATLISLECIAQSNVVDDGIAVGTVIKAKTDSLTFTIPGKLDSHVMYVNSVLVIGTGAPGDRWRAFGT